MRFWIRELAGWLVESWLYLGNPTHPFLAGIFPDLAWSPFYQRALSQVMKAISPRTKKGVLGKDVKYGVADSAAKPNNAVQAEQYNEKPPLLAAYYTYWSNLPIDGRFDTYIRPHRGFAAAPTPGRFDPEECSRRWA